MVHIMPTVQAWGCLIALRVVLTGATRKAQVATINKNKLILFNGVIF
jgi:hypothetical protein